MLEIDYKKHFSNPFEIKILENPVNFSQDEKYLDEYQNLLKVLAIFC